MRCKPLLLLLVACLVFLAQTCPLAAEQTDDAERAPASTDDNASEDAETELATRIETLINQLNSDQRAVRDAAENELAGIGAAARGSLEHAAATRDPRIAVRAARLLDKLPRLTHAVVDAFGEPIAGATVTVTTIADPDAEFALQESVTVESDEYGRIHVPPLPTQDSQIVVDLAHPQYGAGSYDLRSHDRVTVLRFPLVAEGTEAHGRAVQGVVLRADGQPIAGARIRCRSVRTPGHGLVNPSFPHGDAATDQDGRFIYYLPNEDRNRERGELIPVNSYYDLSISVPHDPFMFPVTGPFANVDVNTITLRRAEQYHRFRFESTDGGWIEDADVLRNVTVVYEGHSPDNRERLSLDPQVVLEGRRMLTGKYSAEAYFNGLRVRYQPIMITPDSPERLDFRLPPPVDFRGQVVHGVTGEPLAGAFVVGWSATARQNLALLSPDDWRGLARLDSYPSLEEHAMQVLREHYGIQALVRAGDDGRFEITQRPDQEFYGLMAFAEDFVPFKIRNFSLKTDGPGPVDAGQFALFPAAKVYVRPVHDGDHLPVAPKWLLAEDGQPRWIDRFHASTDGQNREFEYVHWLKLNETQPLYVPAGVRLRLKFETPYNDEWAPATVDEPVQLDPRVVHEIGAVQFAAAIPAIVRVVDAAGRPVEGVPVRRKYHDDNAWCVAHNTDASGQAYFHVNPKSDGVFRVSDIPGPREVAMAENLFVSFKVGEGPPEEPTEISITDEQRRLLLETVDVRR